MFHSFPSLTDVDVSAHAIVGPSRSLKTLCGRLSDHRDSTTKYGWWSTTAAASSFQLPTSEPNPIWATKIRARSSEGFGLLASRLRPKKPSRPSDDQLAWLHRFWLFMANKVLGPWSLRGLMSLEAFWNHATNSIGQNSDRECAARQQGETFQYSSSSLVFLQSFQHFQVLGDVCRVSVISSGLDCETIPKNGLCDDLSRKPVSTVSAIQVCQHICHVSVRQQSEGLGWRNGAAVRGVL